MATTRTPGIFKYGNGKLLIDKEYRGERLFRRLGYLTQEEAEEQLEREIERIEIELHRKAHARPLFRHCAARYLGESKKKRSVGTIAWHVQLPLRHFGDFEPERIHDGTLLRESNVCGLRWTWGSLCPKSVAASSSFHRRRSRPSAHTW